MESETTNSFFPSDKCLAKQVECTRDHQRDIKRMQNKFVAEFVVQTKKKKSLILRKKRDSCSRKIFALGFFNDFTVWSSVTLC